jgi:predicted nucleic acid-binding protein
MADQDVVLDASAMIDLLIGSLVAPAIRKRLRGSVVHVPGHFDAEVLSALGRLYRADLLTSEQVEDRLARLATAGFEHHPVGPLLAGAWLLRHSIRVLDGLYVELARRLQAPLLSTDARLGSASPLVEVLTPPERAPTSESETGGRPKGSRPGRRRSGS